MSALLDDAACRDSDPRIFFPVATSPDDPSWDEPRAICATCPAAADCLDAALARREADGMWGGLTPIERDRLRRRLRRAAERTGASYAR